jgi:MSHA pilin protein MshA
MVELIFVIVIIGILAATALPKFKDVSKNASVANFTKIIGDIESGAVSAYTNEKELVGTDDINLTNILTINGNGWTYQNQAGTGTTGVTRYDYNDSKNSVTAKITLNNNKAANNSNQLKVEVTIPTKATASVPKTLREKLNFDSSNDTLTRTYDLN